MKALAIVVLCCGMNSAWAAQRQADLGVSASVPPVACPAGVTAPSCAPFAQAAATADSYNVATRAGADGVQATIEKIDGRVNIVTLTY
jgi:hypothetical protein